MQNKFKILIPSYNNEEWVEYNIASILNQTYTNYKVVYIDDTSTDNTYNKVMDIVGELPNWNVIRNSQNKGATYNYFYNLESYVEDPNEIVVHLDGDDWFYDETVLEKLNAFYNEKDCWMTYGGFIVWNGPEEESTLPYPQSTEYSDFIHKHKFYRRDMWRASHLRTYRAFLIQAINLEDLKTFEDGKYYWHAGDLAIQYPCMEMCTPDKIQVVDFYDCVYNHSKANKVRTHERENRVNEKYEIEIRNRKTYKEGLSGEKLPQVNVFPAEYYHEYASIPTKFTYCYQQSNGEFDMTVLCDLSILDYLEGRISIERKVPLVARLFEQREYYQNRIHKAVLENYTKFDVVYTYDKELLQELPNAKFLPLIEVSQFNRLPNPGNYPPYKSPSIDTYELPSSAFQIYPKSKMVSAVASSKAFLPGHVKRLEFIQGVRDRVDWYGRGVNEIPSKLDALKDYRFSIAIENLACDDNYFTEKITDCFLTGTIPIYHGCVNIGEFFDERGILIFNTQEELSMILDSLSEDKYNSMLEFAKNNYDACFKYALDNDMMYDMYYKDTIQIGKTISN
jgi:glycosyltransferase involved in cell wall biosynthesis